MPERLEKSMLIDWFKQHSKPKSQHRLGLEYEVFLRDSHNKPLWHDRGQHACDDQKESSITDILRYFIDHDGWVPVMEKQAMIGLQKDGANISLEPGGQFELSGAPHNDIQGIINEVNAYEETLGQAANRYNSYIVRSGFADSDPQDLVWMPKERYKIMRNFMPHVGTMGRFMMQRTCTVQLNIDYESEEDARKKFVVALWLQPLIAALFANSQADDRHRSYRQHVWDHVDQKRCGAPKVFFRDGFSFEAYVDFAQQAPIYFIEDNVSKQCHTTDGLVCFSRWMSDSAMHEKHRAPNINDWITHLGTLFPDIRLKQYMELRGCDLPKNKEMIIEFAQLWKSILYDHGALDGFYTLFKGLHQERYYDSFCAWRDDLNDSRMTWHDINKKYDWFDKTIVKIQKITKECPIVAAHCQIMLKSGDK